MTNPFQSHFISKLVHSVYSLGQTADLSGSGILVVDTLCSSLAQLGNSIGQSNLSSSLITASDSSVNLLYESLSSGLNSLISFSLLCGNENSFLCRFDVSQFFVPPKMYKCFLVYTRNERRVGFHPVWKCTNRQTETHHHPEHTH